MSQHEKGLARLLGGRSDASIPFEDHRRLLIRSGFDERVRGSHHIFRRVDVEERINLQRDGALAKPYQVRAVFLKHGPT